MYYQEVAFMSIINEYCFSKHPTFKSAFSVNETSHLGQIFSAELMCVHTVPNDDDLVERNVVFWRCFLEKIGLLPIITFLYVNCCSKKVECSSLNLKKKVFKIMLLKHEFSNN